MSAIRVLLLMLLPSLLLALFLIDWLELRLHNFLNLLILMDKSLSHLRRYEVWPGIALGNARLRFTHLFG